MCRDVGALRYRCRLTLSGTMTCPRQWGQRYTILVHSPFILPPVVQANNSEE